MDMGLLVDSELTIMVYLTLFMLIREDFHSHKYSA
jgi:hypothetical protein